MMKYKKQKKLLKYLMLNIEDSTKFHLKSDVVLFADNFEKFIKLSSKQYGINLLYCVSLPGYTWQCGMKYSDFKLRSLQNKDLILTLENNIRGGISCIMDDRDVQSDENKEILYVDANSLDGWAKSEYFPYDEIQLDENVKLEEVSNTPDDSDFGNFIEVVLKYPDNLKCKTKVFPFAPENKINLDDLSDSMKKMNLILIHKLNN